jgi:HD-GYP domain-containing protein (c-di-GMP phosphodiesterase class II)
VAAVSARLSQLLGFTESECRLMLIAGHLHDLGKLAVPSEIIEKPSGLQENELNVMRHHTYYTYRILETIPRFQVINKWASFHHERLDGSGYPFHLTARNIPRGSQIMAVADVFTAITEDRPYRRGMTRESAAKVLDRMARDSALSREIVAALNEHYEEVNTTRIQAQASASADYESLTVH